MHQTSKNISLQNTPLKTIVFAFRVKFLFPIICFLNCITSNWKFCTTISDKSKWYDEGYFERIVTALDKEGLLKGSVRSDIHLIHPMFEKILTSHPQTSRNGRIGHRLVKQILSIIGPKMFYTTIFLKAYTSHENKWKFYKIFWTILEEGLQNRTHLVVPFSVFKKDDMADIGISKHRTFFLWFLLQKSFLPHPKNIKSGFRTDNF